MQIVTFDFHNTVAHCDPWFALEIRELPAAVLTALDRQTGIEPDPAILDRATATYRALRATIIETGIEQDAQSCVEQVFQDVGRPVDSNAIAATIELLMRGCLPALAPVPGAIQTISSLIASGVPVGIISSAVYHPFLEWALTDFGLLDRLAFVATSASIGFYKSDVRIYHTAYDLLDASLHLGVHVGDSPRWDIAMARAAGLGTVLYDPDGTRRHEDSHESSADVELTSMIGAADPILALLRERQTSAVRA